MKIRKPCSLVVIKDDRPLVGTAAQLVHISRMGGWDAFLQHIAREVIEGFAQGYNERMGGQGAAVERHHLAGATRETRHVH